MISGSRDFVSPAPSQLLSGLLLSQYLSVMAPPDVSTLAAWVKFILLPNVK